MKSKERTQNEVYLCRHSGTGDFGSPQRQASQILGQETTCPTQTKEEQKLTQEKINQGKLIKSVSTYKIHKHKPYYKNIKSSSKFTTKYPRRFPEKSRNEWGWKQSSVNFPLKMHILPNLHFKIKKSIFHQNCK
jgi:hypothetical protein